MAMASNALGSKGERRLQRNFLRTRGSKCADLGAGSGARGQTPNAVRDDLGPDSDCSWVVLKWLHLRLLLTSLEFNAI